ncbi:hypothetical protein FrEUN1fDRAFT_8072 [Parafrankia sp. EUN1f]|nr:hypothetical protein FrEUN1fDRAFT_8072 [Parafrankia sp. EUN1f]
MSGRPAFQVPFPCAVFFCVSRLSGLAGIHRLRSTDVPVPMRSASQSMPSGSGHGKSRFRGFMGDLSDVGARSAVEGDCCPGNGAGPRVNGVARVTRGKRHRWERWNGHPGVVERRETAPRFGWQASPEVPGRYSGTESQDRTTGIPSHPELADADGADTVGWTIAAFHLIRCRCWLASSVDKQTRPFGEDQPSRPEQGEFTGEVSGPALAKGDVKAGIVTGPRSVGVRPRL